jgi:hypothetical protein
MKLYRFDRLTAGFRFVFEKDLDAHETVIVKMPEISANKRGVNDIGWLSDGNVTLYGTFAKDPTSENALWQEIREYDEVNKTTVAVKIVNNGDCCRIEMCAILN